MSFFSGRPPLPCSPNYLGRAFYGCILVVTFLLAACGNNEATPEPVVEEAVVVGEEVTPTGVIAEIDPFPPEQTTGPVRIQIPEINLDVPIIAMGWRVEVVNGARSTVWDIPMDEAGWHINSVGAGALGNT